MSTAVRAGSAAFLAAAGGLISRALWQSHLAVYERGVSDGLLCGGGDLFDCDAVAAHPSSVVAGFPLPLLGLLFYAFVLLLTGAAAALRSEERRAAVALGAITTLLALAFDAYLALVLWIDVGALCSLCLATYAINITLALVFRWWDRATPGPIRWRCLVPSPGGMRGADGPHHREAFKACYLGAAVTIMFGLHLAAALPFAAARQRGSERVGALLMRILMTEPEIDMTRFAGQPGLGPTTAPMHVAVVGDFQCAFCRAVSRALERWQEQFPEQLRLVFINAPLGTSCNPALPEDLHPDACWLAEVGEAAESQGRFWEYHDHLFGLAPRAVTRERVLADLPALGIDRAHVDAELATGVARARVSEDLELCRELGLTATPSLVIAGHANRGGLPGWMIDELMSVLLDAGE